MKKRINNWRDGDSGFFTDGVPFRLAKVRAPEKHQFGGEKANKDGSINNRLLKRGSKNKGR